LRIKVKCENLWLPRQKGEVLSRTVHMWPIGESLASSSNMSRQTRDRHNRLRFLEKAEGPVAVSVAFEFFTFLHVSFTVRSQIEARKKSWGPDRYSLPNRHRWLHVLMKPDCRPSMRFTFLWILVRIFCPWLRFTRSRSLILSLLLLSLFPSFSPVPHAERLLVVSSFLSYIVSCTWLPALRPARSLVLAAGNRQCTVKSSTHTHTHTYIALYIED